MNHELMRLARRQAGCFTHHQALRLGVPEHDIQRCLIQGEWRNVMADVMVVGGAPVTEQMKAWTAVLAVGGGDVALAACTAGHELGLDRVPIIERVQLVVPNTRVVQPLPFVDIRRVTPESMTVMWRHGMPVTPTAMAIRDIAADHGGEVVRDIVQHALRRRQVTFEALSSALGRGFAGSARLRKVLEEVGPGFQVKWERMVFKAVLARGVRLTPQAPVEAPDGRKAAIDLGIPELKFGVEIDGFLNHMARFKEDRRRARMLAFELEWKIAPYAVDEIARDLAGVADEIVIFVRRLQQRAA
jgi:very-short-patch-repair endonuclease